MLGAGACSDDVPEADTGTLPGDAGEEAGVTQCTSDKDCSTLKKVCDPLKKQCVDCIFDNDCKDSEHCKAYKCVPFTRCKNSMDCKSAAGKPICSKTLGECVACDSSTDCNKNEECVNHSCVPYTPCKSSKDCSGQVCWIAKGKCVDCLTEADCKEGQACEQNRCVKSTTCKSDKDCTGQGQLCDKTKGKCQDCLGHNDCPAVYHCKAGKCALDVCASKQSKCVGNAVATCTDVGDSYGVPNPCGSLVCVHSGLSAACKPKSTPDGGVPDAWQGGDGPVLPPCNPPGHKAMTTKSSFAGDWAVVMPQKYVYKNITITGAKAKQAAAVLDHNVNWEQVAGFVVSRPSSATTAGDESAAAIKDIGGIYATTTALDKGVATKTHDGFSTVISTELSVKLASTGDISLLRNKLVAALLGVPASSLSGLPASFGSPATDFVVRFSTVLRGGGRAVLVGAVTEKASDSDPSKATGLHSRDLANASGLAKAGKMPSGTCDTIKVSLKAANKVDIIWVVDESGSMSDNRKNIANNAAKFFTTATKSGLDFRMGVTNVTHPTSSNQKCIGKFCSKISSSTSDDGGTDRFLLPSEQAIFSACIKNPPCYEGGSEYGLVNSKKAVERHLPRAANSPDKIRTGAQVVIIVVTDEFPNGMTSTIGYAHYKTCTLPTSTQTALDKALKPYKDYFKGTASAESKIAFFQTIGGVCSNSCGAQVAHGYKELAKEFNGAVYDVCQKDLTASINTIITKIKAGIFSSPLTLKHKPITASLSVALDGKVLKRSQSGGYTYNAGSNTLSINGSVGLKNGSIITTAYRRW